MTFQTVYFQILSAHRWYFTFSLVKSHTQSGIDLNSEVATRGVVYEKVFLEIPQNPKENTCAWVSF